MYLQSRITELAQAIGADIKTLITGLTGKYDKTGGDLSGDMNLTGTGRRITGDFSNATLANRLMFQTNVPNSATGMFAIPSGTGTVSTMGVFGNSDVTNSSWGSMQVTATEVRFSSGILGTGTYLPMTFYTNGVERARLDVSGNLGLGITPVARLHTYVANAGIPDATGTGTTGVTARFQNSSVVFDVGVYSSGVVWLQPRLASNNASTFETYLNPTGGGVKFGRTAYFNAQNAQGTISANGTLDFATGQKQSLTLGANITLNLSFPGVGNYQILLTQDATGNRTVSWGGVTRYVGSASAPAINTAANSSTVISIYFDGTNVWLGASKVNA